MKILDPLETLNPSLTRAGKNRFKKMVGWYVGDDGTQRPKIFWFTNVTEAQAKALASVVVGQYQTWHREGVINRVWTGPAIATVEGMLETARETWARTLADARAIVETHRQGGLPAGIGRSRTPASTPPQPSSTALHAATDEWVRHLEARHVAADLSDGYLDRARTSVSHLKRAAADRPLADLSRDDLEPFGSGCGTNW